MTILSGSASLTQVARREEPRVTNAEIPSALTRARNAVLLNAVGMDVYPKGWDAWRLIDPECPYAENSYDGYMEYWDESGFHHDVYMGHTTYYCGSEYKGQTIGGTSDWIACQTLWGWCDVLGVYEYEHPSLQHSKDATASHVFAKDDQH